MYLRENLFPLRMLNKDLYHQFVNHIFCFSNEITFTKIATFDFTFGLIFIFFEGEFIFELLKLQLNLLSFGLIRFAGLLFVTLRSLELSFKSDYLTNIESLNLFLLL